MLGRFRIPTYLLALALVLAIVPSASASVRARPASASDCAGANVVPRDADSVAQATRATTCLINLFRYRMHRRELKLDNRLNRSARAFSRQMVQQDFFDHVAPDGQDYIDRMSHVRYVPRSGSFLVGENIGWSVGEGATAMSMFLAWIHSPEHLENILEPDYRNLGVGIALGAPEAGVAGGVTYTTHFGTLY